MDLSYSHRAFVFLIMRNTAVAAETTVVAMKAYIRFLVLVNSPWVV